MNKKNLTFTVVANMTANYGEALGNISSVQKVHINGKTYSARSMESLKYALMNKAGFYDELQAEAPASVAIKLVNDDVTIENCRALEGGYMSAKKSGTVKRDSSFRVTSAVAITPFSGDIQFHNNLGLATKVADSMGISVQEKAGECGLMPFSYEFDKCTRIYSITIFLDEIGEDDNFKISLSNEEKANRVIALIKAIRDLEMEVKGSLDNAEPLFVVGGLSDRRSHVFENIIKVDGDKILLSDELKDKCENGYHAGVMSGAFANTDDIKNTLGATTVDKFFDIIIDEVKKNYE